jgi:hypothetical protein
VDFRSNSNFLDWSLDPFSGICELAARNFFNDHLNSPSRRSELACIAEEVKENLFDSLNVALNNNTFQCGWCGEGKLCLEMNIKKTQNIGEKKDPKTTTKQKKKRNKTKKNSIVSKILKECILSV